MNETASTGGSDRRSGNDWLDEALRAHRPQPIANGGFTARVMSALPPAVAPAPSWRKPAVAALWTTAVAGILLSLPDVVQDVAREGYRIYTAYPVSVPQLAFAVVAAAAVMWTAAGYAVRNGLAADR